MQEKIYRWILEIKTDKELFEIGQAIKIKVPGFRTIKYSNNLNIPRNILINQILNKKNRKKLNDYFYNITLNDKERISYREKTKDDLMMYIYDEKFLDVVETFISDTDMKSNKLIEKIFIELEDNDKLDEIKALIINKKQISEITNKNKKELEILKIKYKDLENKNSEYKELNNKLKNQINILENNLLNIEKERTIEKQCLDKYIEKNEELEIKIIKKDDEIKEKINEMGKLKEKYNRTIDELKNRVPDGVKEKIVCVFGRISNQQIKRINEKNYDVIQINTKDINLLNVKKIINKSEEIWLLLYDISLSDQLTIKEFVDLNKVKRFKSFASLKKYVSKGENSDG